jgi:hypothetical protein
MPRHTRKTIENARTTLGLNPVTLPTDDHTPFTVEGALNFLEGCDITHDVDDLECFSHLPTEAQDAARVLREAGWKDNAETIRELMAERAPDVMVGGDAEANLDRETAAQEGEDLSGEGDTYINLEPNWEGMRAYILNMFETDPTTARRINAEMGREAATLPEFGVGDRVRHVHGSEGTVVEFIAAHDHYVDHAVVDWDQGGKVKTATTRFARI